MIYRRRHSGVLDVRSFRAAEYDTGHCLEVDTIVGERLAVSKQKTVQISYGEVQSQEVKRGRG
jgi:hypothetical protein